MDMGNDSVDAFLRRKIFPNRVKLCVNFTEDQFLEDFGKSRNNGNRTVSV